MGAERLFEAIRQSKKLSFHNLSSYEEDGDIDSIWAMYEFYSQKENNDTKITILQSLIELGERKALTYLIQLGEKLISTNTTLSLSIIDHIVCLLELSKPSFSIPKTIGTQIKKNTTTITTNRSHNEQSTS